MYKECDICREQGAITYYKNKNNDQNLAYCDECTGFLLLDDTFESLGIYYTLDDFEDDIWDILEEIEPPKELVG